MKKSKIITLGIAAAIAGLFLQFVYLPKAIEVRKLGAEYRSKKAGIAGLYNFIGGEQNLKDNLIKMRDYIEDIEIGFPSEKDASNIIKELNEAAGNSKVSVISVKPWDLADYTDARGARLTVSHYLCKSMPISLSVEARYHALGDFLNKIEASRDLMVSVRKVDIKKDISVFPRIKADIELNACVLGE